MCLRIRLFVLCLWLASWKRTQKTRKNAHRNSPEMREGGCRAARDRRNAIFRVIYGIRFCSRVYVQYESFVQVHRSLWENTGASRTSQSLPLVLWVLLVSATAYSSSFELFAVFLFVCSFHCVAGDIVCGEKSQCFEYLDVLTLLYRIYRYYE